ncbi:MAG: glycoside hydrolase family 3 C-terminal domain-containing protein [Bacteroidota bacterium]
MSKLKAIPVIALLFLVVCRALPQNIPAYKNQALPVEARVRDLLARMTPEEKFWQLFMIPGNLDENREKYKNGIFGLQLSEPGNHDAAGQIAAHSPARAGTETARKINDIQKYFAEQTRLGIPIIPFEEALHGLIAPGATAFPQAIALAATWDTSLVGRVAAAIAAETRSSGIRQILSPVVNIAADVRWGRTEETYGEDPFLSSCMGVSFASAFEKRGIVTTPKHFIANLGDGGRDSYPVEISERQLEELYLPPFSACFNEGGSRSVMTSYNSLNGSPCTANDWLLNTKLKQQMKFKGFTISDACAVGGANVLHYTAADYPDAAAKAINNGLDVILQTEFDHYKLFIPPFLDGRISMKTIDEAVARVLRVKFQLGLFDNPYTSENDTAAWSPLHRQLAGEAALKSIVLLKNDHQALPLRKSLHRLAVIGTDAVEARLGGYSGPGNDKVTILEGIRKKLGEGCEVSYTPGCGRNSPEWVTVPASALTCTQSGRKEPGLEGEYFNNILMDGNPVITRIDKEVNFRWTLYSPDPKINFDFFSARWSGMLKAPATGRFKIGLEGNDGYRLFLDGKLLIDNRKNQSFTAKLVDYDFMKDREYALRIEFSESSGSAWLKLVWDAGVSHDRETKIEEAAALAGSSDAAIVVAGINEGEGLDRASLNLPGYQEEMINRVAATGKPVIVVLVGGSAITMSEWMNHVDAIVDVWYPGEEGGNAVAGVLFGDYNPAGRLPVTFPLTEGQLPLVYNHKPTGRNDDYGDLTGQPLFPFGFGLSYTTFEYRDISFDRKRFPKGESTVVHCKVRNSGRFDGDEVVQLYIRDILASVARPVRELKGFQRIRLLAGEEKEVSFALTPAMLKMLNNRMEWVVEPGDFRIMIGSSSRDTRLRDIITVE